MISRDSLKRLDLQDVLISFTLVIKCHNGMKRLLLLSLLVTNCARALTIQIDYTYDTSNFFNTQGKRDAIEAVAKFYGDLIQDNLLRIDQAENPGNSWTATATHPATGGVLSIPALVVPANTIIVYVGARDLGGSTAGLAGPGGFSLSGFSQWFALVRGRGSAGAASSTPSQNTDFSPWGGSMSFDIDSTWNFSQTQNVSGSDFISIALHEMGHVLGIGTSNSWTNKISSSVFTGSASTRSYGANPPIQSGGGHFGGTNIMSKSFGSFNVAHGTSRQVLMLPSLTDNNSTLIVASDLDLAALVDIGWQINPPLKLSYTALNPTAASFSWNTSSFFDYKLQRGTTLANFPNGNTLAVGNGSIQLWTDPSPPVGRAFYRLARTQVFPIQAIPALAPALARAPANESPTTDSQEPRVVEGCGNS